MQATRKNAFKKFYTAAVRILAVPVSVCFLTTVNAQEFGHSAASDTLYFPLAQFKIPFNVDSAGRQPSQVQLWVSTDEGTTWQLHGSSTTDRRAFDFRAAAEGLYLFSVRTLDENGRAFSSPQAPMRVLIDTTRPQVELRADMNAQGEMVVDVRINEANLKQDSVHLRYRTDQETQWNEATISDLVVAGQVYEGQVTLKLKQCREVALVVTVADEASNIGDATYQYSMPRTAAANQDMMLASQRNGTGAPASAQTSNSPTTNAIVNQPPAGQKTAWQGPGLIPTPGAIAWPSSSAATKANTTQPANSPSGVAQVEVPPIQVVQLTAPQATSSLPQSAGNNLTISDGTQTGGWTVVGKLAGSGLSLDAPNASANINATANPNGTANTEELPAPPAIGTEPSPSNPLPVSRTPVNSSEESLLPDTLEPLNNQLQQSVAKDTSGSGANANSDFTSSPFGQAFHCNSRAFSLDYALNEVAGSGLADVELWGTEDGGRVWQRWGSDPDRQSPFDVQVANDGLFGFRMVIVSQNGTVSNRPKNGDSADAWINVDTQQPAVKITRAVYGEGHEAGLLVLDYTCSDANLHERPLTFSYSETLNGPWVTITTGLKNTGIYLWKPPANLPEHVFLKLEAVDRAGNIGTHNLDLPINIQGLAPRGRIQGFRPINNP